MPPTSRNTGYFRHAYGIAMLLLLLVIVFASTIVWNWMIDVSVAQKCLASEGYAWCRALFNKAASPQISVDGIDIPRLQALTTELKTSFYLLSTGVVAAIFLFFATYALFDSQRVIGDKLNIEWKGKTISANASGAIAISAIVVAGFVSIAYLRLDTNIEGGLEKVLIDQQRAEITSLKGKVAQHDAREQELISDHSNALKVTGEKHENERAHLSKTFISTLAKRWQVPTVVTIECAPSSVQTLTAEDLKAF